MQSIHRLLFENKKLSPVWLVIRFYLGYEWISAGYEKIINPAWAGFHAGSALTGFVNGALAKAVGAHPDVSNWYAWFLTHVVLPNVNIWSHAIAYGEVAVGVGLVLGALTFFAALFGFFMNLNYLLSGTVSINPQMLVLSLIIMLAYRTAGYIGLDYWLMKLKHF